MNLVIISSVINVSKNPLNYTKTRSVFSAEERYIQTLKTIESLSKIPNKEILFVETSDISIEMENNIKDKVDYFFNFKDNEKLKRVIDGNIKSAAEGSQLKEVVKNVNLNKYDSLIKISGRYWLNDNFNFENYNKKESYFREAPGVSSISTVLYKIDKKHFDLYKKTLDFCTTSKDMHEADFLKFFQGKYIPTKTLGISGFISVDGIFINL